MVSSMQDMGVASQPEFLITITLLGFGAGGFVQRQK